MLNVAEQNLPFYVQGNAFFPETVLVSLEYQRIVSISIMHAFKLISFLVPFVEPFLTPSIALLQFFFVFTALILKVKKINNSLFNVFSCVPMKSHVHMVRWSKDGVNASVADSLICISGFSKRLNLRGISIYTKELHSHVHFILILMNTCILNTDFTDCNYSPSTS